MVGSPSSLLFCTVPLRPPCGVVWSGVVVPALSCTVPLPPPVAWCGCARGPAPNIIIIMMMMMIIIIIIINGWYPLKPAVLRASLPPPLVWCGWPPPAPPCAVVGGGGGYHWGGGGGSANPEPGSYTRFRWLYKAVTERGLRDFLSSW